MEIKSSLQKLVDPYTQQVQKNEQKATQRGQSAQASQVGDRVSVSPQAKLFTEAYTTALSTADVRQEKVDALKEQIANGSYTPDSKKIAEKLLESEIALHSTLGD